mmetsp:Transcript_21509/g.27127  ORF Transcript_21509/g.27127 Transcript_21509/m.27127 type:complete len:105 (-) Transcript_21509:318-632(-)
MTQPHSTSSHHNELSTSDSRQIPSHSNSNINSMPPLYLDTNVDDHKDSSFHNSTESVHLDIPPRSQMSWHFNTSTHCRAQGLVFALNVSLTTDPSESSSLYFCY